MYMRKEGEPFAAQAARCSLFIPLLAIVVNVFSGSLKKATPEFGVFLGWVLFLVYLGCFGLAIYALFMIRKHGRKGILGFAVGGLVLNLLIIASFIYGMVVFPKLFEKMDANVAEEARANTVPVFENGQRFENVEYGYSFEVPASLPQTDPSAMGEDFDYAFILNTEGTTTAVGIQRLRVAIAAGLHEPKLIKGMKDTLPPEAAVEWCDGLWMGRRINGFLTRIPTEIGVVTNVSYHVPLKRGVVQILVIDTNKTESELKDFAAKVLSGMRETPAR